MKAAALEVEFLEELKKLCLDTANKCSTKAPDFLYKGHMTVMGKAVVVLVHT